MTRQHRDAPSIRTHLVAIGAAALLLVGGIGMLGATTGLSGAVVASGSLVVESSVKKVQHPTGGIVGTLLVTEGSHVAAGGLFIRPAPTTAQGQPTMIANNPPPLNAKRAPPRAKGA